MIEMRPFWRYYGAKWMRAKHYPAPRYSTIVEPFAGAAGYSLRWYTRDVVLVEKYDRIAAIWRYLIGVEPQEILAIPDVEAIADLPAWVSPAARDLVGFNLNNANASPCTVLSSGAKKLNARGRGRGLYGWGAKAKKRIAGQVPHIRHWRVISGDYTVAPDVEGTWFVDAPYEGRPGECYVHGSKRVDYAALGAWCRARRGQAIVCEGGNARWLPFRPHGATKGMGARKSQEAIWTNDPPTQLELELQAEDDFG